MKTLGLEFSSDRRSAAVWVPASASAPARFGCATQHAGRATRAFTLIREALDEAGVACEEIERIAIGLGPGSATGIRTAIAIAQGWTLGLRVGLVGVSSLECLAARLQAEGLRGEVGLVVDAQRGEFHLATFALDHAGWRELTPLRLASAGDVQALLEAGTRIFGPAAAACFPTATDAGPDAATLARLGASREALPDGAHLDAIHLRQPAFAKAPAVTIR
jgi:tRNA threonylcarbamoyladenosine biosynthesis protein TsaB